MKEHFIHYLVLLVVLDLAIASFFLLSFNRTYQVVVVVAMGVCYFIWGIIHHKLSEDLHFKVILEYVLVSLLGVLLILSLLWRA